MNCQIFTVEHRVIIPLPNKTVKVRLERGAPDNLFVSKLAGVKLALAEQENERAREDVEFRRLIEETLASGGRSSYIQICAPYELYALTRLRKPKHIVEVGVSAGVSSTYFLRALESNGGGVLHSIDLPERQKEDEPPSKRSWGSWALPLGKEPGWAIPQNLKKDWDLRLGKSSDVLPDLINEIDTVDLFLYDVPYEIEGAIQDFKTVDEKLGRGGIVLADNCLVPISWWAKTRGRARLYTRRNSGLRGFSIS